MSETEQRPPSRRLPVLAAVAVLAAAGLGLGVLYGTDRGLGNGVGTGCATAVAAAARMAPLAHGEVAAVQVEKKPRPATPIAFKGPDGRELNLGDFKGRTVLLNLWATWCAPCRAEMPALDALQNAMGGPNFEVVAVNIDTRNFERPKTWLSEAGVSGLTFYSDPTARVFQELKTAGKAFGMPTTLIIDGEGCELASIAGPAEWSSEDGLKLVRAALGS